MLFSNITKAIKNLFLPAIIKLFLISMLLYVLGWMAFSWVISGIITSYVGIYGAEGFLVSILTTFGASVLAWFMFPLLYPLLLSFFDDKIVTAVETEDYPHLPKTEPPFWPTIMSDALFALKAIGLNILFLPLYMIPLLGMLVYYLLNGSLLGKQFFNMVAGRHVSKQEADSIRSKGKNSIYLIGIAISVCATIPLLNFFIPVLGIATMLHLFHDLKGNNKQQVLPPSYS